MENTDLTRRIIIQLITKTSLNNMETKNVKAFGTTGVGAPLKGMTIQPRVVTPHDVEIEILFCGICHSDLHQAKNDFGGSNYPMVPGHEMVAG
jgi:uncharacterized zinc-type alcohol dehydrogenase-like protein